MPMPIHNFYFGRGLFGPRFLVSLYSNPMMKRTSSKPLGILCIQVIQHLTLYMAAYLLDQDEIQPCLDKSRTLNAFVVARRTDLRPNNPESRERGMCSRRATQSLWPLNGNFFHEIGYFDWVPCRHFTIIFGSMCDACFEEISLRTGMKCLSFRY